MIELFLALRRSGAPAVAQPLAAAASAA